MDKLAYDNKFCKKSLENYNLIKKKSELSEDKESTRYRMDRDKIASEFSDAMNKIHQILSSNGMTSGLKGVTTAIYRHYLKIKLELEAMEQLTQII